jgi:hypothetical protein
VGHDDVETVGGSALKDDDQPFVANAGIGCAKSGTRKKARQGSGSDNGQCAVAKKNASSDGHRIEPIFSEKNFSETSFLETSYRF